MVADRITSMAFATFLFSCEPPAELIAIDRSKSESYTIHSVLVWHERRITSTHRVRVHTIQVVANCCIKAMGVSDNRLLKTG